MRAVRKILAPTDFSEGGRPAARYAVELAETFEATVMLLHVYQAPGYFLPDGMIYPAAETMERLLTEVRAELAALRRELTTAGGPTIGVRAVEGAAASEICRQASAGNYDLIVMGTHGRTGLQHLLVGSVAERVLRHAPCPVVTVPYTHPAAHAHV
jgi:nucleotide-binding universal stress UspA family protein